MDVRRREQLITLSVTVGLVAVFAVVLMLPGSRRLRDLRRSSGALVEDQQRFAEQYGLLAPQLAQDIERLTREVDEAVKRVPPEDIRVDFEQALRQLGEQYDLVGEHYFMTTTHERDGSITIRGAKLRFQTTFMDLYTFLKDIRRYEKLTILRELDVQPAAERDGRFDVSMELKYFYGEL